MSEYQITLPKSIYHTLLTVAQQQAITPADWIAAQLPSPQEQPLSKLLTDLIGSIDSQTEPHHPAQQNPFGQGIAAKLARQGIHKS